MLWQFAIVLGGVYALSDDDARRRLHDVANK